MFNRKKKNQPAMETAELPGVSTDTEISGTESDAMLAAFEDWLETAIPDSEKKEAVKSAMTTVCAALDEGDYDDAFFEVIAKGADYDRAVEQARIEGEIAGRNTRIDELFDPRQHGDGLPHLGTIDISATDRAPSIFDVARQA